MATRAIEVAKDVWLDGHGAVRLCGLYLTEYHRVIGYVLGNGRGWVLCDEKQERLLGPDGQVMAPHRSRPSAVMKLVDVVVNRPETGRAAEYEKAPEAGSDWDATMTRAQMEISDLRTAACQPDAILRRLTGAADVLRERDATMCELVVDAGNLIRHLLKPCDVEAAEALLGRLWETGQHYMFGGGDTTAGILMVDARDAIRDLLLEGDRLRAENANLKAQVERLNDRAYERSERDQ